MHGFRYVVTWVAFAAILAGCVPPLGPVTPTAAVAPTPVPYEDCNPLPQIAPTGLRYAANAGEYFIQDQIVLTGLPSDIKTVVTGFELKYPNILGEPKNQVSLSYLREYPNLSDKDVQFIGPFPVGRAAEVTVQLYPVQSPGSVPMDVLIEQVYELAIELKEAGEIEFGVYPDPNYLIGRAPVEVSGDPNCGEGSPAGASAPAGQGLFWNQWAFGKNGINLLTVPGNAESRTIESTGRNVRVGVFDTSPFKGEGGWSIPWIRPQLNLCVSHLGAVVQLESLPDLPDYRDHGLFVSGLVHAVAPDSEIYLIRVLNESNQGDLDTLVNGLGLFTEQTLLDKGTLESTVINLSLGIHPAPELTPLIMAYTMRLIQMTVPGYLQGANEVPVVSLQTILDASISHGAVVVAAAGNDSGDPTLRHPANSQIPATYSNVIGVAGSSYGRERACFSNAGDVAAPSGNNAMPECTYVLDRDVCEDQPELCMVSLAIHSAPASGFSYWIGTSFAAPLVSGQAALLRETNPTDPPKDIVDEIYGSATPSTPPDLSLGVGIINLP